MGLYVWVEKVCPCGGRVEFQSKAHPDQDWGEIDLRDVPIEMAKDIDGETAQCYSCGKVFRVKARMMLSSVPMEIEECD